MNARGASPDLLTPDQAAAYLQVDRDTVHRYIREGRLIASQLGWSYWISRHNLVLLPRETQTGIDAALRDY